MIKVNLLEAFTDKNIDFTEPFQIEWKRGPQEVQTQVYRFNHRYKMKLGI